MTTEPSLADWMAAAQRGDEEAYRQLLEAVEPMLFRYVRRRIGSDDSARDVCQEILMTMHRARHTHEPTRPLEPWLYSIARTRLIDHLRRERRISRMEILTDTLPELPQRAVETSMESVLEVLDRLPPAQREAFAMLKIEGLSTEDAAARAGVTVSALKVRAHRAYNALKKVLGEEQT